MAVYLTQERLTVRMPSKVLAKIKRLAKDDRRTVNATIVQLLDEITREKLRGTSDG